MARSYVPPQWIAVTLAVAAALIATLYGFHRLEQFLIRDPRFTFNPPVAQSGDGSGSLAISGSTHVNPRAIEAAFSDDFGLSAYLIPLSDRRDTLRTVAWVKDASVARFWPNRVVVGVTERKPVAFVGSSVSGQLIDEEGVILPPVQDHFLLPVLDGVRGSDPIGLRHERVQRFLKVMKDLGDASHSAVEVDVTDPDDVKLTEPFEGRRVTLLLGDHDFALRHQNFVRYYSEIVKRMPDATVLDLRVEDRITVVPQKGAPKTVSE